MSGAESRMQVLNARYQASLPNKRASVELAWRALCADSSDPVRLEALMRLVHRLAGSAPSYGYREIGQAAASADALLERLSQLHEPAFAAPDSGGILDELTPLIDRLLESLDQAAGAS